MDLIFLILIHLIPISLMTTIFLSLTTILLLRVVPRRAVLLLMSAWTVWRLNLKRVSGRSKRHALPL